MENTFDKRVRRRFKASRFILIPLAVAGILALVSFIVMQLWNNLLPDILHVNAITYWQAMGIFVLCKILFGFGKGGGRMGAPWMRGRMAERMNNMSPEEHARFKQEMEARMCGSWRKRSYGRGVFEVEEPAPGNQPGEQV